VFRWRQNLAQQEAVQTIPWPAISPDMNPIEHVWDFIGRKINQRNPKCQNIDIKNCYLTGVATVPPRTARLYFLKDYTNGSKITNLRSIYHPERRDYDVAKMGFKTGAGKT
jgi:hypothetical protein